MKLLDMSFKLMQLIMVEHTCVTEATGALGGMRWIYVRNVGGQRWIYVRNVGGQRCRARGMNGSSQPSAESRSATPSVQSS